MKSLIFTMVGSIGLIFSVEAGQKFYVKQPSTAGRMGSEMGKAFSDAYQKESERQAELNHYKKMLQIQYEYALKLEREKMKNRSKYQE